MWWDKVNKWYLHNVNVLKLWNKCWLKLGAFLTEAGKVKGVYSNDALGAAEIHINVRFFPEAYQY